MVSVHIKTVSVDITFARFPSASHFGLMPTSLGKTTPPERSSPDQANEQTDAARRRARQGIREYELIWLLQQRLRAMSWPHCGACAACCSHTARPRHGSYQTLITLTRRPLSVSRALHVLNSCVLIWRRLPLICLKLLVGVCVQGGPAASVCVYRTSAAFVELRPRGWRAGAFPYWHHYQSGLMWLIVILIVRCCFGGLLCVRDGLAACLRMSHFCCFR